MSDNSSRAVRRRHAQAALEIVEHRLLRIEQDALGATDFIAVHVVARVRDAVEDAHEMIDRVYESSTDTAE